MIDLRILHESSLSRNLAQDQKDMKSDGNPFS